MWVTIDQFYAGQLGLFFAGQKYDLPKKTVADLRENLGDESVIDTCAPWEERTDHKLKAKTEAIEKANQAIKKAELLRLEMVGLRKLAARIDGLEKEIVDADKKAKSLAKAAVESKVEPQRKQQETPKDKQFRPASGEVSPAGGPDKPGTDYRKKMT